MPKAAPIHLDVEAVLAIHAEVIAAHGGGVGLRDRTLLESAVAAPRASFAGEPLITDTIEIGAAYLYYLSRNHPFVDGNKRTALAACLVFLQINGALPDPGLPARDVDAWEALVFDIAASREDRSGLTKRLKALLRRKRVP
ncbi:MAG: type II toxin-antitoxin system death-on-curing family toxin [Betaproteobacteria bacterium]